MTEVWVVWITGFGDDGVISDIIGVYDTFEKAYKTIYEEYNMDVENGLNIDPEEVEIEETENYISVYDPTRGNWMEYCISKERIK